MKQFKMRCSSISKIMGKKGINLTGKSYCKGWITEQIYGKYKEINTKYTEKGNICEDDSIDFIAKQMDYGFLIKNEESKENDFIKGTADVVLPDLIIDVKNSWDCFTFPLFEDDVPNIDYYWQLQGYMWLYGKEKAKLIYVLSDTPTHLIEREAYYWCKNNGYEELDIDIYKSFIDKMTYSNISDDLKIKSFDIERNDQDIELIKERVIECRKYIETLKTKINVE